MVSVYDYTKNSSCLADWRKQGAAPAEFLRELRTFPRWEGLIWRGTSERSITQIDNSPILSTSKSLEMACHFSTGALVCFWGFEGAYDISCVSAFSYEEEVIIVPEPHKVNLVKGLVPVYLAMPSRYWNDINFISAIERRVKVYTESIISTQKVVRKYVEELGFYRAIPIINFQIKGTSLWVTGELSPKRLDPLTPPEDDPYYIPF